MTKPIPISAAKELAMRFGYDQVIVYARVVGEPRDGIAEHMTTYGKDKANCDAAAKIGEFLKYKIMGWDKDNQLEPRADKIARLQKEIGDRQSELHHMVLGPIRLSASADDSCETDSGTF